MIQYALLSLAPDGDIVHTPHSPYSLGHDGGTTMEDKSCSVFVDGKECDRPLTLVDLEGKKIARYDLATYECNLRHRTYFLLEPK